MKKTTLSFLSIALVILFYSFTTFTSRASFDFRKGDFSAERYNLLTAAILNGQVHLDVPVDPKLETLEDPTDPTKRKGISVYWDASYYRGEYYFYWGIAP